MANETASLLLAVDSRQVKDGARSLDDLAKSGAGAEQATKGLTSASDLLAGTVRAVVGAYSSLKLGQFISEATSLNQRYSQMGLVMSVVAANTGKSRSEFDTTANTLQKLGISMLESRNTVIKLATANVDLANAEKLADLARNAAIVGNINTSQALDRLVLGVQSAQVEVLRGIGINVSFERSYNTLAKQMGVSIQQLTESQKQQARLNAVLAEATNFTGLYEASLANAGKMMKSTERLSENLKIKIGAIFDDAAMLAVSAYSNQLLDLNNEADRLAANNSIKDWSRGIAIELAFVMDMGRNVFGIFGALGGLIAEQGQNLANLDFDKMTGTFAKADEQLKAVLSDTSKYQDMVNSRIIQEDLLTDKITGQNNNVRENTKNTGENTKVLNENTEAVKKAAKVKDELALAELKMQESTKNTIDLDRQVKSLISSVATEQDKYNDTLKELDRLKPYVPVETYNRALKKAQEELKGTSKVAKEMTTETNEYARAWGQTWTSIEQTGKTAFIQFAAHGTGAMKSIGEAIKLSVLDMLYQLTVRKWMISIGASLESSFINSAVASGGGVLSGASSLFSMGSNLTKGLSGFLGGGSSGVFSNAGGAGTAFIGGPGTALGGSGMGGMSSMMSMAGPIAGAAAALAASVGIGSMIAGDKKVFGMGGTTTALIGAALGGPVGALIAGSINALFGRGPMKQQGTLLEGQIGAEGFESGVLQTRFKAKGGLLRSDKIDFARVDAVTGETFTDNKKLTQFTAELAEASKQIFKPINDATKQTSAALRDVADNLSLSTTGIDNFSYSLKILTEKGELIKGEQISEEIAKISDGLAKSLMPGVEEFKRAGETTVDTLMRLSGEFSVLTDAARVLFDKSSGWAKDVIGKFGFTDRSEFLLKGGGADTFAANVLSFAKNFYSEDQFMKPFISDLVAERDKQGLSGINTRQQAADAMMSGNLSPDQVLFLVNNQEAIDQVFDYTEKIKESTSAVEKATAAEVKLAAARNYAAESFTSSLNSWKDIVTDLTGRIDVLNGATAEIFPMSMIQARSQIANGSMDSSNFNQALSVLTKGGGTFSSALDESRSAAANAAAIRVPADALQARLGIASNNVRILENYRNIASFDVGGRVPRDGMAMLHKDEQVFTRNDSMGMAEQIKELKRAVDILTIANNKINRRFGKWDDEGLPATRTA